MALSNIEIVEPVFFKQADFDKQDDNINHKLSELDVCKAMGRIIGDKFVDGAQHVKGLWRLYCKTKNARVDLLLRGTLSLMGRIVKLYDENPFSLRTQALDIKYERITIKDLPFCVSNDEVQKYLEKCSISTSSSNIKYSRIRDENDDITNFRNGDRFVYVPGPISPILKRHIYIADTKCRLFHDGQFGDNCKICKVPGHLAGDVNCTARNRGCIIVPFRSHLNVLSNFFPCDISVFNEDFKSAEHAYQWKHAIDAGLDNLAERIKKAPHAGKAKSLSKEIPKDSRIDWETTNIDVMESILLSKVEHVPEFRQALIESEGHYLAESTSDTFWASGLSSDITELTDPNYWPGLNKLGILMMNIRSDILRQVRFPNSNLPVTSAESKNENDNDNTCDDSMMNILNDHSDLGNNNCNENVNTLDSTLVPSDQSTPQQADGSYTQVRRRNSFTKSKRGTFRSRSLTPTPHKQSIKTWIRDFSSSPKRKASSPPDKDKVNKQSKADNHSAKDGVD